MKDQELKHIDEPRMPGVLNKNTSIQKKVHRIFVVICTIFIVGILGYGLTANMRNKVVEEPGSVRDLDQTASSNIAPLSVPQLPPLSQKIEPKIEQKAEDVPETPLDSFFNEDFRDEKAPRSPDELADERKRNSAVIYTVPQNSMGGQGFAGGPGPDGGMGMTMGGNRMTTAGNSLGQGFVATATPKAQASVLQNRDFLLTKGTFIEGVMETAMSSDLPGMVKAVVTTDVYSSNGNVVLLERGTRLIGEFTGQLRNGQARVWVLWTRAETPHGVVINLDSGAADELGRSGLDGYVDNHWALRLGASLFLSTWSDLMQMLVNSQNNTSGDNNYITYDNTSRMSEQMASEVLRDYINIPPTLLKNQGDPVRVFVARDLDFSEVYELSLNPSPDRYASIHVLPTGQGSYPGVPYPAVSQNPRPEARNTPPPPVFYDERRGDRPSIYYAPGTSGRAYVRYPDGTRMPIDVRQ